MAMAMVNKGPALPVGGPNSHMGLGARGKFTGHSLGMADFPPQVTEISHRRHR